MRFGLELISKGQDIFEKDIKSFEAKRKVDMPSSLKTLLLTHNGES